MNDICHCQNDLGGQFILQNFGGILILKRSCILLIIDYIIEVKDYSESFLLPNNLLSGP